MTKARVKPKDFGKAVLKSVDAEYQKDLKRFKRVALPMLKQEIIESIFIRGVSPVAKFGKYKAYSKSYKQQIRGDVSFRTFNGRVVAIRPQLSVDREKFADKDIRPINLTLSGDMLKSLKGRQTKDGFAIWFADPKAKWHDKEGAGKSKVIRRLLPNDNEKFNQVIVRAINSLFNKTF